MAQIRQALQFSTLLIALLGGSVHRAEEFHVYLFESVCVCVVSAGGVQRLVMFSLATTEAMERVNPTNPREFH